MKKLISLLAAFAVLAFVSSAFAVTQIKDTSAGYQIADSATQKVGFFGATPVVQPTSANQAAVTNAGATNVILTVSSGAAPSLTVSSGAAPSLTLSTAVLDINGTNWTVVTNVTITAAAPVTNVAITAAAPVTNVAVNTVWGYTSAGHANGFTTLINAIRSALVSLGLLKGS